MGKLTKAAFLDLHFDTAPFLSGLPGSSDSFLWDTTEGDSHTHDNLLSPSGPTWGKRYLTGHLPRR